MKNLINSISTTLRNEELEILKLKIKILSDYSELMVKIFDEVRGGTVKLSTAEIMLIANLSEQLDDSYESIKADIKRLGGLLND